MPRSCRSAFFLPSSRLGVKTRAVHGARPTGAAMRARGGRARLRRQELYTHNMPGRPRLGARQRGACLDSAAGARPAGRFCSDARPGPAAPDQQQAMLEGRTFYWFPQSVRARPARGWGRRARCFDFARGGAGAGARARGARLVRPAAAPPCAERPGFLDGRAAPRRRRALPVRPLPPRQAGPD